MFNVQISWHAFSSGFHEPNRSKLPPTMPNLKWQCLHLLFGVWSTILFVVKHLYAVESIRKYNDVVNMKMRLIFVVEENTIILSD